MHIPGIPVHVEKDTTLRVKIHDPCGLTCTFCHNEGTPVAPDNRHRTIGDDDVGAGFDPVLLAHRYRDRDGRYQVGVCIQRMDLCLPLDEFLTSPLLAEIRDLREAEYRRLTNRAAG